MGTRGYNVWTTAEEDALRKGVKKHGLGAWEIIRKDPEFKVLENRTGVQLKDKFRNLVKFRHISLEESKGFKPKGSGPWSRKHTALTASRERSVTPNDVSIGVQPAEERENTEEHAAALLALDAGKSQGDTTASDAGGHSGGRRKRRRSQENRSFGIYDQRRYQADGTLRDDTELTESDENNGNRPPRQRRSTGGTSALRRSRGRSRRRNVDDETTETTTEEEDYVSEEEAAEQQRPRQRHPQQQQPADDSYIVDCPCGVTFDDGHMMVECESCKTWAHIGCLQYQAAANPAVINYDFNNYQCLSCQGKLNPMAAAIALTTKANKQRQASAADMGGLIDPTGMLMPGIAIGLGSHTDAGMLARLGLANGDVAGNGAKQLKREATGSGSLGVLHPVLSTGALQTPAYLDSLSLFLAAAARPSSALGHRGPNSPRSNPTSPSKGAHSRNGIRAPDAAVGNHEAFDKLLAAANAPSAAPADDGAAAVTVKVEPGAASPTSMRRAASNAGAAATAGGSGDGQPQGPGAGGTGVAGVTVVGRPASRGPVVATEMFGDSDDDLHHSAALAHLFAGHPGGNDRLLQMISANRAATPSQMFLEQLMRGATPDITLAPLIQGAALQGAAAAAAAAAQAQLHYLHQASLAAAQPHPVLGGDLGTLQQNLAAAVAAQTSATQGGAGSAAGTSSNPDSKANDKGRAVNPEDLLQYAAAAAVTGSLGVHPMELRPGTPDTWALLRGSTPTPDAMGLHHSFVGIPPLAGFTTDPTWLLHRGSPALHALHDNHHHAAAAPVGVPAAAHAAADAAAKPDAGAAAPVPAADGKNGDGSKTGSATDAQPGAATQQHTSNGDHANGNSSGSHSAPQVLKPVAVLAEVKMKMQQEAHAAAVDAPTAPAGAGAAEAAAGAKPPSVAQLPGGLGTVAAQVMELVDRKASLGTIGSSAHDLASAVGALTGSSEEAYFNVEDMLRSNTPAPR